MFSQSDYIIRLVELTQLLDISVFESPPPLPSFCIALSLCPSATLKTPAVTPDKISPAQNTPRRPLPPAAPERRQIAQGSPITFSDLVRKY